MSVVWPTRTPATSVMALSGPGRPRPMTIPRSRARIRRMLAARAALGRSGAPACLRAGGRPYHPAVIPSPTPARPTLRHAPAAPTAGPRRGRPPDRRRRGVPRPARASPCSRAPGPGATPAGRYLTADPSPSSKSPAAGPDPFAVARRLVARLDATPVVPAGCAAVPRRARRLPRLRPRRRARAAAGDRGPGPGPAAAPARAPRLGRRLGPADGLTPGSAVGRSTATGAGSRAGSTTSTPA